MLYCPPMSTIKEALHCTGAFLCARFPLAIQWLHLPGLLGWLPLMAGVVLGAALPYSLCRQLPLAAVRAGIVACLCVFCVCRRVSIRIPAMVTCGLLALTAQRADEVHAFERALNVLEQTGFHYLTGRVVSPPLKDTHGYTYVVRCDSVCGSSGPGALHRRRIQCTGRDAPAYGREVSLRGRFRAPRTDVTPGAFDEYRYLVSRGLWGRFTVQGTLQRCNTPPPHLRLCAAIRGIIHATLAHVDNSDNRAVLQAALLGERTVPAALKAKFRDAGISHLLAISGLHVGILTAALLCLFAPVPLPRRLVYPAVIAMLWGYVGVVGPAPSLARAAMMATLFLGSFVFQRTSRTLNALGVAGIIWLLLSPASVFTPGYQLSFAATFGIVTGMRFFQELVRGLPVLERPVPRHLYNSAAVSFAAFLSTLPAVMYHFGVVSLFGLAANLVVVVSMTWCMWLFFGAIAAQMISPMLAGVTMQASSSLLSSIVAVANHSRWLPPFETLRPPLPLCACYAAFLVGAITVRRRSLRTYLSAVAPLALIGAGLYLLIEHNTRPVQFWWRNFGNTTIHVVGFANGEAWLLAPDTLGAPQERAVRSFLSARRLHLTCRMSPVPADPGPTETFRIQPVGAPSESPANRGAAAAIRVPDGRKLAAPGECTLEASSAGEHTVCIRIGHRAAAQLSLRAPPHFNASFRRRRRAMPATGLAVFRRSTGEFRLHEPYAHHPLASEPGDSPFSRGVFGDQANDEWATLPQSGPTDAFPRHDNQIVEHGSHAAGAGCLMCPFRMTRGVRDGFRRPSTQLRVTLAAAVF
ncbi:MAG: DUF4131 domain-containing protein [Chitinivibrionales bacterium]|nr:DUF4131 domain-containing protein [Chitinivibrionales bacterium]